MNTKGLTLKLLTHDTTFCGTLICHVKAVLALEMNQTK